MIKKEELIEKYPEEVLIPVDYDDDDEESNRLYLFFGTSIKEGQYYELFYAEKLYNKNNTFYYKHEQLPAFIDAFNLFGERFVNLDMNLLKKKVLKDISTKIKKDDIFSSIKEKMIADALVKNDLDDEEKEDYNLSEQDIFEVIVKDSELLEMIKKSFVFDQEKYNQTDAKKNINDAYNRIKSFINEEIKDANTEKDEFRIKILKNYQKFFDELLLTRINEPKKVILTDDYLTTNAEFKMLDIHVKDLIPDDIKKDIVNKINTNIHISLDDVYNSIQDYHKDERFFEQVLENGEEFFSNEFVDSFVNACLPICKKEDGKNYSQNEILFYLMKQILELKKETDKLLNQYLYEKSLYDDTYDTYDNYNSRHGYYDEDYYYNGYDEDDYYNGIKR